MYMAFIHFIMRYGVLRLEVLYEVHCNLAHLFLKCRLLIPKIEIDLPVTC